jgi:hypothetical protein
MLNVGRRTIYQAKLRGVAAVALSPLGHLTQQFTPTKLREAGGSPRRLRRTTPRLAGQILLPLAANMRPCRGYVSSDRHRNIGGGFVPPAVAHEIRFKLQQRGLSQAQLGQRIGRCMKYC